MKVKTKHQCEKCKNWFSAKGGNYKKHIASCNGQYKLLSDLGVCCHCNTKFDLSDKPKGWMANHSRWCEMNPKRKDYTYDLSHARSFINEESKKKAAESISFAHKNGAYEGSQQKAVETKRKNGTLNHTEEAKQIMREKALASPHRRLKKNTISYKGVTLDSTWELHLAQRLDELSIEWIRPDPLPWTDKEGCIHNYFADFYLPYYDLYLDPKNPYAVEVQKEKLEVICKTYKNLTIIKTEDECKNFVI